MKRVGIIAREVFGELKYPFGKITFFFEDMIRSTQDLEVEIFVFSPLDWNGSDEIRGFKLINEEWIITTDVIPKVIYDRFLRKNESLEEYTSFIEYLKKDCRFLSPFNLVDTVGNKITFHRFLEKHQIPSLPATILSNLDYKTLQYYFSLNNTLYIKPLRGSRGFDIVTLRKVDNQQYERIDKMDKIIVQTNDLIQYLKDNFSQNHFLVQPKADLIDFHQKAYDVRVLVQNRGYNDYQITGMGVRIGATGSQVSNLDVKGAAMAIDDFLPLLTNQDIHPIIQKIERLCLNCTQTLHQAFGEFAEVAFDILITEGFEPIILEANSKPSRWVFVVISDSLIHSHPDKSQQFLDLRTKSVRTPVEYALTLI